jgi:membrane associated rhomboid family serine protease
MHARSVKWRTARIRDWFADLASARACLAVGVGLVAAQVLVATVVDSDPVYLRFGLSREGLAAGKFWQLASHAFIHGNIAHLLVNLAGFLLVGSRVERIGSAATLLQVFMVGVISGGLLQLLLAPPEQQGIPLVGASGGVSALLLWLTTVSPESRTWPLRVSGRNLGRGLVAAELGFLSYSWVFPEAGGQSVAHACHLGGALAGWWLARRLFRPPPTLADLQQERARRESADGPSIRS